MKVSPLQKWSVKQEKLAVIEQHYSKKENILFPYLERYGISGPPSVMWGIHDATATVDEWKEIQAQLQDPFAMVEKGEEEGMQVGQGPAGIELDIGILTSEQISLMLTHSSI